MPDDGDVCGGGNGILAGRHVADILAGEVRQPAHQCALPGIPSQHTYYLWSGFTCLSIGSFRNLKLSLGEEVFVVFFYLGLGLVVIRYISTYCIGDLLFVQYFGEI